MPLPIRETAERSEDLYHAARKGDWTRARVVLGRLTGWVRNARSESHGDSANVDRLESMLGKLSASVHARDRLTTMSAANECTLLAANLSDPFAPLVPTDVDRLDYYGRALQVAAEQGDLRELRELVRRMRRTWGRVRPATATHSLDAVRRFDAVATELDHARSRSEFARAANKELEAVDVLERSFRSKR